MLVALIGSTGRLELAIVGDNAAARLGVSSARRWWWRGSEQPKLTKSESNRNVHWKPSAFVISDSDLIWFQCRRGFRNPRCLTDHATQLSPLGPHARLARLHADGRVRAADPRARRRLLRLRHRRPPLSRRRQQPVVQRPRPSPSADRRGHPRAARPRGPRHEPRHARTRRPSCWPSGWSIWPRRAWGTSSSPTTGPRPWKWR